MDMPSELGSVVIFDKEMQKKARIKSLRKTVYNVGMGVEEDLKGQNYVPWLCSLTYRDVNGWSPNHIKIFINRVRAHLARRGLSFIYVWVAELQKRGALHYHILIWLPKGFRLPKFARFGWWEHGFTDQKIAKKSIGYLMKYVSKDDTKNNYPKGVRIYGYGGVSYAVRRRVRFFRVSVSIRQRILSSGFTYKDVDLRPCLGGRVDLVSGWFFPSLWKCMILGGVPVFFRVFEEENEGQLIVDISQNLCHFIDMKGV